ncbi:adhesion G-protein coupled receptor G2-like [Thalassophryne amazonica]|uniref:adhesion G-protein coupled receptor G2-like n=1 Tax=Thalassophryne amazonica TaxID=390379 RepID=UPI0014726691|nr:adhesion G-protein coupled receptor G2-like [Thalassophryne amazonica]
MRPSHFSLVTQKQTPRSEKQGLTCFLVVVFGFWENMICGDVSEIMKASVIPSCGCASGQKCVRVKKPHVGHKFQILVFLLAGLASRNHTSAVTFLPTVASASFQTTKPTIHSHTRMADVQNSVYYFVDTTVVVTGDKKNESDVTAWLRQVFQNNLENCMSPNHEEQTTTPISAHTTSDKLLYDSANMKTRVPSSSATAVLTLNYTMTPSGSLRPKSDSDKRLVTSRNPSSVTTQHTTSGTKTMDIDLFQGIEVSCAKKIAIKKTTCVITLKVKQSVHPCCILRALCVRGKNSSDIHAVGQKVERVGEMVSQNNSTECRDVHQNTCISTGHIGAACENSTYMIMNSTRCEDNKEAKCTCSAYCNQSDAFYAFQIQSEAPTINVTYIYSLISHLKQPPTCSPSALVSCPLSTVASEYKDAHVDCGSASSKCRVILHFSQELPICVVSAAVNIVLQPMNDITFIQPVTRAAICGNSNVTEKPLLSPLTWVTTSMKPSNICTTITQSNITSCHNRQNVCLLLDEKCDQIHFCTSRPNVTTVRQNVTLSITLNATAEEYTTTAATTTTNTSTTDSPPVSALTKTTPVNSTTEPATSVTAESVESQAYILLTLSKDASQLNYSQVEQLLSQLENLLSGPNISLALGNISVNIVSNLQNASADILVILSSRIIGIVDTVGLKLVLPDDTETLLSPSVALSVKKANGSDFEETVFFILDPTHVQVRVNTRRRRSLRTDFLHPQGFIKLPRTLTQNLPSQQQQQVSRVQFNYFQESSVFQDPSLGGDLKLNSGILGASATNLSIRELQDDIEIYLRNTEPIPDNFVARCVFWDYTLNDGFGGWNQNGCFVKNSAVDVTVCGCNHLTSFAILLDLSRKPITSRVQADILTFITYIGCGVSAIFLSVTLLTYLAFGKLRKDAPSKILVQLCLALLLLNLVFLVDSWLALYPQAVGLCISTAWFLHYFLLVSFTWMGLEAVHMYLALIKVFNSYIPHYMVKFSLVGWGVPLIVVIIVIAIDKDNYGLLSYARYPDSSTGDFCWLKSDIAFYVAVVAYFCIIFLFNFIMFIVVLVQLCRLKKHNPHNTQHRTIMQDARSVAGITVLLGLTWGFAFFAWGPVNLPFMYLFAIFNSLQGFFIFVFYCAMKENVRRQWRTYLCCGKLRLAENSDWSRTATQKTVRQLSVVRQASQLSWTKHLSSSSSFLVSDSAESVTSQITGVGSPFEDEMITVSEQPSTDVILNEINRRHRSQQAH